MKTISASQLRTQLTNILKDLESGPVSITKHGNVVAVISAPSRPVEAVETPSLPIDPFEPYDAPTSPLEAKSSVFDEEDDSSWMSWDECVEDEAFDAFLRKIKPDYQC